MRVKRWQFAVISVLSVAAIIALLVASEQRAGLLGDLEAENAYLTRRLQQSRDQLRQMTERQLDLEQQLFNVRQMEQICCSAPSRDGRQITVLTMPLDTPSGYTAARFERVLSGTVLAGIGEALVAAEEETGINALVLAGICAHESGWGASRLAKDKCNLAGLGAYPGAEYSAGITFGSRAGSVMFLAELLAVKYAPGGCYFGGSFDLTGVGVRYASDPAWAAKVGACVKSITQKSEVSS